MRAVRINRWEGLITFSLKGIKLLLPGCALQVKHLARRTFVTSVDLVLTSALDYCAMYSSYLFLSDLWLAFELFYSAWSTKCA